MKGPTVQPSLHEIILKFRIFQYVLTGDIEKMFRQVLVHEQDQKHQLILWRKSPKEEIAAYKLKTVTYGTTSASFVTTYTINHLAKQFEVTKPEAAKVIRENFYVDDLMMGAESPSKLLKLKRDVVEILSSGGFNLRKFTTNDAALRKLLNSEPDTSTKTLSDHPDAVRVLGIRWNPVHDTFMFSVDMPVTQKHTKRTFLSEISQIFDPHGWLAPLLIRPKMLLQSLWLCKLEWDDELPVDVANNWQDIRAEIVNAAAIRIPRWLEITEDIVFHGFCDASERAYASVIYVQSRRNGEYLVNLVGGKSRVAPLKQRSLPQLELLGAQLLTNHMKAILDQSGLCPRKICLWTDSNIVLDWLSSHPGRWKTFVANRVSIILENYSRDMWRHVPTKHNPADCATRGLSVADLLDFSLWWKGPDFLHKPIEDWPQQKAIAVTEHLYERKSKVISQVTSTESNDFLKQLVSTTSKYRKLLHIVCYIRRVFNRPENKSKHKHLSVEEANETELWLCRETQKIYFKEDYERLAKKGALSKKGPLLELSPFLDEFGVMRVGGRLQKSLAHYNRKHPIILHAKADLTQRIVYHYHEINCHPGPGLLLQLIREKFWIIRGKDLVRRIFRNCIKCIRYRPKMHEQLMGELPIERVRMTHPFASVGLDFAGPFRVHPFRRRGAIPFKAYLCVIVCLSTKAVHLECCMELSTQSFLGALKRFVSRRGLCNTILCDNGTNFVGTANYLKDLEIFLTKNNEKISKSLLDSQITWKFNPPGAPHMGGMWEAAVRSTKTLLKRTVGEQILTLEEFTTLSCQIESILNSRPIAITSSDELDLLTPAHFLIHRPMNQVPDVVPEERLTINNRWDIVRRIVTHFWRRWHVEFLSTLQCKSKWRTGKSDVKLDDVVLIQNNNLPPGKWQLGRIVETHEGADGRVRVVTVKTMNGNIRRPITKISILPVNESPDSWPAGCLGSTRIT